MSFSLIGLFCYQSRITNILQPLGDYCVFPLSCQMDSVSNFLVPSHKFLSLVSTRLSTSLPLHRRASFPGSFENTNQTRLHLPTSGSLLTVQKISCRHFGIEWWWGESTDARSSCREAGVTSEPPCPRGECS